MLAEVGVSKYREHGAVLHHRGGSDMKDQCRSAYLDKVKNIKAANYFFQVGHEQRLKFFIRNIAHGD